MTDDLSPGLSQPEDDAPQLSGPRAVLHLLELMEHNDPAIRTRAALELGEQGNPRVIAALVELLLDDMPSLRRRTLWALARIDHYEAMEALLNASLRDTDWGLRQLAGRLLNRFPPENTIPALEHLLTPNQPRGLRARAIEVLGLLRNNRAAHPLIAVIQAQQSSVIKKATARPLAIFHTPEIFDALVTLTELVGIGETATALTRQPYPQSAAFLYETLQESMPTYALHRSRATRMLGHIAPRAMWPDIRPMMVEALAHSDKYVRQAAIDVFGRVGEGLPLAEQAPHEDDWHNQLLLGRLLRDLYDEDIRDTLLEALTADDQEARLTVAAVLTELAHPDFETPLLNALEQTTGEDGTAFVQALAPLESPQVIDALRKLLTDPEENICMAAMRSIAGKADVTDIFLERLEADDPYMRNTAIYALGEQGAQRGVAPLIAVLESDVEGHERSAAVQALGKLGDLGAAPILIEQLDHHSAEIRAYSAKSLSLIGVQSVVPALINMLFSDKHPWGQRNAAEALGVLGDERAIHPLLDIASYDSGYDGRHSALVALGRFDDRQAVPILIEALLWENNDKNRTAAAESLGMLGDPTAIPALITALGAGHGDVRLAALAALAAFDDDGIDEAVQALLEREPHWQIREAAERMLA